MARGLAGRVLLTKLVELDGEICLYLTALMVAILAQAGETWVVSKGTWITTMIRESFDNMLLKETSHNYNNYRLVSWWVLGLGAEGTPEEVELAHCKRLESRLDQLTSAMTSLTERLTGECTRQAMEYEEESMHNVPTAARNAIMSIAKKVEDNVLCVRTMLVIMPPSTTPKFPAANPPSALLRVPNALIIK